MHDLPPDLVRLRTLETWLAYTLDRVRTEIAEAERREQERQHGEQARPPAPEWLIQHGLNRKNVDWVHTGDCWMARKSGRVRGISREQAIEALRQQVPPCPHCRPDTALGILDG
jgi:hypothetical protein